MTPWPGSAKNIGALLDKKNVYFVPFRQDDPVRKPTSVVADFGQVTQTIEAALAGKQLQPLLLGPAGDRGEGPQALPSPIEKDPVGAV